MFDPIPVEFGSGENQFKRYLFERIDSIEKALTPLFDVKYTNWRKLYQAVPAEMTREFPWHGASNLIVPIVGMFTDMLHSRIMAGLFKALPLWIVQCLGEFGGLGDDQREALEEFLGYVGMEPEELDLYRVYHEWFGGTIKYGTMAVKVPWFQRFLDTVVPMSDGSYEFNRVTRYAGPRPETIPFQDFWVDPSIKSLEDADITIHRNRLQKHQLMERQFYGIYPKDKVDQILKTPTRSGLVMQDQSAQTDFGIGSQGYPMPEWDIFECWTSYEVKSKGQTVKPHLIASYHKESNTLIRCVFNNYTDYGCDPFIVARLYFGDGTFFGRGFGEILGTFQQEISEQHNTRRDNTTIANMKGWRVDPLSKLGQEYRMYPSVMVPARQGEIEALEIGTPTTIPMDEEKFTMELAERRSGVVPPMSGMGAGGFNKRGIYSSMGTMAVMQDSNSRQDLHITDMRMAHTKMGRLCAWLYATFGIRDRAQRFGKKADLITQALDSYKEKKMALPINSATAGSNKELDKQTDIMLAGMMDRHWNSQAQLLQSLENPTVSPQMKQYVLDVFKDARRLMKQILRDFGKSDVDNLVPDMPQQQQQGGPPDGQGSSIIPFARGGQGPPQMAGGPGGGMPPPSVGAGSFGT